MIRHIVMWRLHDEANGYSKVENARRLKDRILQLKDEIDVIRELEAGINFTENPDALDVALVAVFANREDLQIYQVHPAHQAFKQFIQSIRSEKRVVDYDIDE